MKVSIRNTAIRLLGVIILAFFIIAAYSTLTVNAASVRTQEVITKIAETRQYTAPNVTPEKEVFVTKYRYKKGLIFGCDTYAGKSVSKVKYQLNKKGKYTRVKGEGVTYKITYSKGRAVKYSGRTPDYEFCDKLFYNSKGLCSKYEFEGAIGGTDHYYYDKKGRIKRVKRTCGSYVDFIEKYKYDKKGNICRIKEKGEGEPWITVEIKNTYSGGKLITRSYEDEDSRVTIEYTYKKIKTPAKYKKRIKRQQAWLRGNGVANVPLLFTIN